MKNINKSLNLNLHKFEPIPLVKGDDIVFDKNETENKKYKKSHLCKSRCHVDRPFR